MFIQTQETPNPETLKFIPGNVVIEEGTATFHAEDDLSRAPLAQTIFNVKGIKSVFFARDFVTVTKQADQDWSYLKPLMLSCIMDHFMAGFPAVLETVERSATNVSDDEITKQIKEIIETKVRPAVAQDGGDITFKEFKDGVVYLEMHGACSGCPSSTVTLKSGIENMLKHYIPEVISVESV